MSARIAKLPHLEDEGDEENDGIGELPRLSSQGRRPRRIDASFSPLSAEGYFEQAIEVSVSHLKFRVYYSPPSSAKGTVFVCHHGAGYSGLSFACLAKEIRSLSGNECGVLALDARKHGKTNPLSADTSDRNLSVEVLSEDLLNLLRSIFPNPQESPNLILVGHSMGGTVVVRTCPLLLEFKYRLTGVVVLEAVEGFALEALPFMHQMLDKRPDGFDSPAEAIEWQSVKSAVFLAIATELHRHSLSNNTIKNLSSARISVPSLIAESNNASQPTWIWRTPLRSTSPFWENWFTGLSKDFLGARTARLLVLAGTERLDKELMIGQMQGKFQLEVIPEVGHMLHEDDPSRIAEVLVSFWRRNDRILPGVKKVGEL